MIGVLVLSLMLCCLAGPVTTTASAGAGHRTTRTDVVPHAAALAAPAPVAAPAPLPVTPSAHTVRLRAGDTLWGLAQHYGTTVGALQTLNHLGDTTLIRAGAELRLPTSPAAPARSAAARTTPARPGTARTTAGPDRPATGSVQQVAATVFGSQYACAAHIIARESGWNVYATNRSSGAYGLAQALPGQKMALAGPDWRSDPLTQLRWMHEYVTARYGGACGAWAFWQAHSWY